MPRSRLLALSVFDLSHGQCGHGKRAGRAAPGSPSGFGRRRSPDLPPPRPQQPLPAELAAPASGLATEFAERLSTDGRLRAAEKADRTGPRSSTRSARTNPSGSTPTGFTPAGEAVADESRRADDWGLDAAAFPPAGARIRRRAVARAARRCRDRPQPRHPQVCPPRARRPRRADHAQQEPRSQAAAARSAQVIEEAAKAEQPDAFLRVLHPQHPQFEALRQKYLALKRGQPCSRSRSSAERQGREEEAARHAPVAQRPQAARQHGAVALDARAARRLLRVGQRPRVHAARRQERQGHPHRARHRRQAPTRRRRSSRTRWSR